MAAKSPPAFLLGLVFAVFLISNAVLAYSPLPAPVKIGWGLLGILAPGLALFLRPQWFGLGREKAGDRILPALSPMVLALMAALALFLRFYRLADFSTWPSTDEGWINAYALDLSQKWDWKLLYGFEKATPFYIWVQAGVFKILKPSLFSLWLTPAVFSLAALGMSFAAAKQFFPPRFSLLCALLMAFGFWPLLTGRIGLGGTAFCFLELAVLALFGKLLKEKRPAWRRILAGLWGLVLVCGFYTGYLYWAGFCFLFLVFLLATPLHKKITGEEWGILALVQLILLAPLAWAFLAQGLGHYVNSLWAFNPQSQWAPGTYTPLSYITSLLWWADPSGFIYRPQWGGFLNPVAGSFFLLGLGAAFYRRQAYWRWIFGALLFLLMPGLLSKTYEMFRIISLLPLLVLVTALGIQFFIARLSPKVWVLAGLFCLSLGLDSYHLFGAYRQAWANPGPSWQHFKSLERWRAFEALRAQSREDGPGFILADFIDRNFDPSLDLATFSFNAAENPALSGTHPQWVAILFPDHLRPFLQKRFPQGRWMELAQGLPPSFENKCLGILPNRPQDQAVFSAWIRADLAFSQVARRMRYSPNQMTYQQLREALAALQPAAGSDPLLESCFDQKMVNTFDAQTEAAQALFFVRRAIQWGYPSAYFIEQRQKLLQTLRGPV